MSSYNTFAQFYDTLTENVDYKVRSDYISNFFCRYGNGGKALLDLACGTGTMCRLFADKGYDVTGIELSQDMLTVAYDKCGSDVKLLCGDMTDFSLPERFDYCLCSLDSINHLNTIDDVKHCFSCVRNSLNENGIFIFDVNTVYKHNNVLADSAFIFDYEDFFVAWDNEHCGDNKVRILLDIFVYNGTSYDRFSEEFCETAYDNDTLINALEGFEVLGVYEELTENSPKADTERVYYICKRK